tara:strand:+ start:300 stop:923 length:624 start_codon:yes stop_codon:yes gene_type:complete
MKTKEWYKRQSKDFFVKEALQSGFVSRSAFKIIEIEKKFNILDKSKSILELGASPGGWTQSIIKKKNDSKYVFLCIDEKPLKIDFNNNNVYFIKENFYNDIIVEKKIKKIYKKKFDLILSDMSPDTTGNPNNDHIKIIYLANKVLEFSIKFLEKNGNLIIKIFQGIDEKELINKMKKNFASVKYFKPKSSRKTSREIYIVSSNFKNY